MITSVVPPTQECQHLCAATLLVSPALMTETEGSCSFLAVYILDGSLWTSGCMHVFMCRMHVRVHLAIRSRL